jgi:hypothetical protein
LKKVKGKDWSWAALLGLWVFFHWGVLFSNQTFVYLDAGNFFYPLWKWGGEAFKTGHIPLWNPDMALGFPYLADPENLLWYPPKFFFYWFLTAGLAFKTLLLSQSLWLLTGFWFFIRPYAASPWARIAGALAFAFSFEAVALETASPALFITFSWVPWVFMAAGHLWAGKRGGVLCFSFCFAMQLASGYPVYAYLTLFSVLLWKVLETLFNFKENKNELSSRIFSLAASVGLAALYNLSWILPFKEFVPLSNIARRLDLFSSLGFSNLATWLNPFFCGHPLVGWHETPFSVWGYFMGLPTAVIILWALIRRKGDRVFAAAFGAVLLFSLGKTLGVGEWLRGFVPGYSWVARSGYWLPLVCFFAAVLTSQGVQVLLERKGNERDSWFWFFISSVLILLALALGVPVFLLSFWAGCLFLLLAGWKSIPSGARGFCMVLAMGFSLLPAVKSFNFTLPQTFYDERPPAAAAAPAKSRIFHTPDFVDQEKSVSGKSVPEIYQKFKGALLPNWPLQYGLSQTGLNNAICLNEFLRWYYAPQEAPAPAQMKFIRCLNTGMIIGNGTFPGASRLSGATDPVWVNIHPLPKWWSVSKASPQRDWGADFKAMADPNFDFAKSCYVADPQWAGAYRMRSLQASWPNVNEVDLEAPDNGGRALFISSELAYPGWGARVEGLDGPLEVVNDSFRGVVLKPGETRVVLNYQPACFRLGMFFSLLAVGIWFFALLRFFGPGVQRHVRS